MKKNNGAECRSVRNRLLDLALAPQGREPLPPFVQEHLRTCPGCARYGKGLRSASRALPPEPLYTPALRRRTLAAVERRLERPSWLAPLLFPASTAGLAVSMIVPVCLLSSLLRPIFGTEWMSLGFAIFLSGSAGLAATGLGFVLLIQRRKSGPMTPAPGHLIQEVFHE